MGVERSGGAISRRQLLRYGAYTGAAATVGPMLPAMTSAAHAHGLPRVLPAPKPIPGGIQIPGGPLLHVLEADMRAMEGTYLAEDGTRQRGLFAFI
jgi:hypothetical protein